MIRATVPHDAPAARLGVAPRRVPGQPPGRHAGARPLPRHGRRSAHGSSRMRLARCRGSKIARVRHGPCPMIILVGVEFDAGSVRAGLGASGYSYWYVVQAFRPVLERLGLIILVRRSGARGGSAAPPVRRPRRGLRLPRIPAPNAVTLGLACPTIPVFAWEFESLPDESWRDDPRDHLVARARRHRPRNHPFGACRNGHAPRHGRRLPRGGDPRPGLGPERALRRHRARIGPAHRPQTRHRHAHPGPHAMDALGTPRRRRRPPALLRLARRRTAHHPARRHRLHGRVQPDRQSQELVGHARRLHLGLARKA